MTHDEIITSVTELLYNQNEWVIEENGCYTIPYKYSDNYFKNVLILLCGYYSRDTGRKIWETYERIRELVYIDYN